MRLQSTATYVLISTIQRTRTIALCQGSDKIIPCARMCERRVTVMSLKQSCPLHCSADYYFSHDSSFSFSSTSLRNTYDTSTLSFYLCFSFVRILSTHVEYSMVNVRGMAKHGCS